ncbi:RNA 2'-phosphotransferase [Actinomadura sp. HBU206391]|nr:RNA 2'-phosphotransferase [Actinomadura sp. HBU206391]
MDERRRKHVSKFLAKHLRHRPELIGITLDGAGWTDVGQLLIACARHGCPVSREELVQVVAGDGKRRYAFDETGRRVRASQGHSVAVDLDLPVTAPPDLLYHGTVERALPAIRREGLQPMGRRDVHLSVDEGTARQVGTRRGRPIVLTVNAAAMAAAGLEFRLSANGVWLTRSVPPRYLR